MVTGQQEGLAAPARVRVLFVVFNLELGGAEWVSVHLMNEAVRRGWEVALITDQDARLLRKIDAKVRVEISGARRSFWKWIRYLASEIKCGDYDLLFCTQRHVAIMLSVAHMISRSRSRLVIREAASNFRKYVLDLGVIKNWGRSVSLKIAYRRADLLVANSSGTLNGLKEEKLVRKNGKTVVLGNPLDIGYIRKRAVVGISDVPQRVAKYRLVTIGRLMPRKRIQDLVAATNALLKAGMSVETFIVGDGPYRGDYEALVAGLEIGGRVLFLGKLDNPYPVLASADVFVLPSEVEGFGMVLVEALALGVPIVATDIEDGPRGILDEGRFGVLYPPGDVDALVKAIRSQLEGNQDPERLIGRAYDFDKERRCKEYLEAFAGVLK